MNDHETIEAFMGLFMGNEAAYGADHGECIKVADRSYGRWFERFEMHLTGQNPIGVYPHWLDDTTYCAWGCTDLDYTEDPTDARNIASVLHELGINAWVEISKSKGFHVWTFPTEPIDAAVMRAALLFAHQVADVPAHEINPKQAVLAEGQIGNYIRLPYPGALGRAVTTDGRRMVLTCSGDSCLGVMSFLTAARAERTTPEKYEAAAALYRPPHHTSSYTPSTSTPAPDHVSALAKLIIERGPLPGKDRSTTMFRLAYLLRDEGFGPAEAHSMLRGCAWQKFAGRSDEDQRIGEIVDRVYS